MNLFKYLFRKNKVPGIFCDAKSTSAIQAFNLQNHRLYSNQDEAEILWMRKGFNEAMSTLKPHQLINHFPNESALINKGYLTQELAAYEEQSLSNTVSLHDFYPETFCLFEPKSRKRFFDQLPATDSRDNIWIFKPGNNSRGRGIKIMWRTSQLRKKYELLGDRHIRDKNKQAIIQRYIKNPLLLEGKKSEIRVYWLLASLDPLMVLLFDEGTVRLNSLPYKLDDFDNQLIHVTNVFQQHKHPDYDPNIVLKWSFSRLDSYLSNELKIANKDFTKLILIEKLKKYLAFVVKSGRQSFFKHYPVQGDCFGLYGADVILDENLNPFISEIQIGPGLSFSDPIKRNIIPPMLGEAANIMFEIRACRAAGKRLTSLKSRNRYQWVINEAEV